MHGKRGCQILPFVQEKSAQLSQGPWSGDSSRETNRITRQTRLVCLLVIKNDSRWVQLFVCICLLLAGSGDGAACLE